jgi:hypothetical protein
MAITFYRALITSENYESFRRLLNDAPETFDKWSHIHSRDLAYIDGSKGKVAYVEVDPNEFATDCRATGAPPNLHSLNNFAFKKGTGKKE